MSNVGSQDAMCAPAGRAATIVPFGAITADALTYAPIFPESNLIGVIEWFFSCFVPTLPAGRLTAAYLLGLAVSG